MSEKIREATWMATEAHAGDIYRPGLGYMCHVVDVANIVKSLRLPADVAEKAAIVAYLHDAVEDGGVNIEEIKIKFGTEIATLVDAITRRPGETYDEYLDRAYADPITKTVKIADIMANLLQTLHPDCPEDKRGLPKRYLRALQKAWQVE